MFPLRARFTWMGFQFAFIFTESANEYIACLAKMSRGRRDLNLRPHAPYLIRSFQNCLELDDDLEIARRSYAQTTGSRHLSGLIDKAERASAPLASKIGGGSGIGRDSGGDAGELQHVTIRSSGTVQIVRFGRNMLWRHMKVAFRGANGDTGALATLNCNLLVNHASLQEPTLV
jgi:hypothetical protein